VPLIFWFAATAPAWAMDGFFGSLDPAAGRKQNLRIKLGVTRVPDRSIKGDEADLGWSRSLVDVSGAPWKTEEDRLTVSASVDIRTFRTDAILPDSGLPFPGRLWKVRLGLGYLHRFDERWSAGVNLGLASASDRPFHSGREIGFSASAFLRAPQGKRSAWLFYLGYAATGGELNAIPFAAVGFFFNPCDAFQALVGIPFVMVNVRPLKPLMISAVYAPVTNVRLNLMCFLGLVMLSAGFHWSSEGYFLAERPKRSDQLYQYEKKMHIGLSIFLGRHIFVTGKAGWSFDREFSQGRAFFGEMRDRLPLENGGFVAVEGGFRF
jgi:hypothetical protein